MTQFRQCRVWLPAIQLFVAATLGEYGLWLRNRILSKVLFGDQTLWQSTARFHVWPWPYKLAFMLNLPALLVGAVIGLPLEAAGLKMSEMAGWLSCLPLVALLWYAFGLHIDTSARPRVLFAILLAFIGLACAGLLVPGYTGFAWWGCVLWIGMLVALFLSSKSERA